MLQIAEALAEVLKQAKPLPSCVLPLAEVVGRVLAEPVVSDVDSPPADKSLRDGYALRASDVVGGVLDFAILEEVVAGDVPRYEVGTGQATRLMTGVPIPRGADAVVMFEHAEPLPQRSGQEFVRVTPRPLETGSWILRQGQSLRLGEEVLSPGVELRPVEIGLLAEVGRSTVRVIPQPRAAMLPTGDEIVPPHEKPRAGQIRNSNGPLLAAALARAGAQPIPLPIGPDRLDELRQLVAEGLKADLLLLSGGVSAGVRDLVPHVLRELGVRQVFHKVRVKPGQPLWFGVYEADGRTVPVFGLPGNPIGALVCFELFVRPALRQRAGFADPGPNFRRVRLSAACDHRGDRPTFHPARGQQTATGEVAELVPWEGSPDIRGVTRANGFLHFPAGDKHYPAGTELEWLPLS